MREAVTFPISKIEFTVPKSAIDVLSPTFHHTQTQLFSPFQFGQWVRLALLGLATGELSTSGGCGNLPTNFNLPQQSGSNSGAQNFAGAGDMLRGVDPALLGTLVVVLLVSGFVLMLVWIYTSSVCRFMLFESVLKKRCDLRGGWSRWQDQGLRYFWWQMGLTALGLAAAIIMFAPVLISMLHTLKAHQKPSPAVFLAILPFVFLFAIIAMVLALVAVLTKDFVIPQMALENIGVIESWRRLLRMLNGDKGGYAAYIGMKILLFIGASILFGIIGGIAAFVVVLPFAAVGVAAFVAGKAAGLHLTLSIILLIIAAGLIALTVVLYVMALVCVPLAVFFPAYAMYFLADRYPLLHAALFPTPPMPQSPPIAPLPLPIG